MRRFASLVVAATLMASTAHASRTLPYDDGTPVPAGYHVEERSRTATAITGGAFLAVGATMFTYGFISHRNAVEENERSEDPGALQNPGSGGQALMIGGGLLFLAGVPIFAVGFTKKKVLVADDLGVVPVVTPTFGGLSLTATF